MVSVEICARCHVSTALTSHKLSFGVDLAKVYQNPTEPDVSCMKNSIRNLSAEMADLAQEIESAESVLIALKSHRAHLDMYIQQSTRFVNVFPLQRFPSEVLGIIFAFACTSFQRSEYKTPLSISLVCSKWRDIAVSTPSLWTHIYIAPYSYGLDVYEHFLERCGNIPISVKVDIPYQSGPPASDGYHAKVFSAITQNSAQWKVLELRMNREDMNLLADGLEAPILESLTLENDGPEVDRLEDALFHATPSLTKFTVQGENMGFRTYVSAMPWRRLRKVCIPSDMWTVKIVNDRFDDGKNRTLVLRPPHCDITVPSFYTCSLRISTLVLDSVIWSQSLTEIFRGTTIPTLENLTMLPPDPDTACKYFAPAQWNNPFSALPKFLSACALQSFTVIMRGQFNGCTFMFTRPTLADGLVVALQCMTELGALCIIEAESGPSLFSEQLLREMAEGQLLPKLTSLEMVWAEERQPQDSLVPMLCSRGGLGGAGANTISSVVLGVRNGGDLRGDVLGCMSDLRQKGIRATLW